MSTAARQSVADKVSDATGGLPWRVVWLLMIGMIIAYFDRVNLSVAKGPMGSEFGWTSTQEGLALSAIFWSYTILQIPAGILVDRYGVRLPYLIGFLVWSFASAATFFTTGLTMLIAIRLLVGMGEAVVTPASMRYIRLHFGEEKRGRAVGLYMMGTKLGPFLGLLVSGWLVGSYGWRVMFVLIGVVGLVWLVPWLAWVKKDDIAALSRDQRESAAEGAQSGKTEQKQQISTRAILSSPVMWGVILGTFCYMYFVYYSLTWMPSFFVKRFNMSIEDASWYPGVSFGGMSLMIWVGGWAADWFINKGYDPINVRKAFTIMGFVLAATQTAAAFTDDLGIVKFFAIFSLCGLGLATANYWALTQSLIPAGSIAMVVGIQNTSANLAGVVAPIITGWLIDQTGSFDAPIKFVGFWLVLGIAGYAVLVRRKYAPQIEAA